MDEVLSKVKYTKRYNTSLFYPRPLKIRVNQFIENVLKNPLTYSIHTDERVAERKIVRPTKQDIINGIPRIIEVNKSNLITRIIFVSKHEGFYLFFVISSRNAIITAWRRDLSYNFDLELDNYCTTWTN